MCVYTCVCVCVYVCVCACTCITVLSLAIWLLCIYISTIRTYNNYEEFVGIPSSAVLGEPYDIECPYESNPPAQYEWSRVPSCGSIGELLDWSQLTILYNNNKTLRLGGTIPILNGYYNCTATNSLGCGWFCHWRKIDVSYKC